MDATRPNDLGHGDLGHRCESDRSFRAISVGHGGGRDLKGIADFANGRRCAKSFGNSMDSKLTAGGAYVTGETKTSFKGYYRASAKQDAVLIRSFVQFDGEGETANARQREIGGHPAELLKNVCLRKDPHSPYGTVRATFCTGRWWITLVAAATAAPVGRGRRPGKSSPW